MRIGIDASCLEVQRGGVARILTNMLKIWPRLTQEHQFVLYFEKNIPSDAFLQQVNFESKIILGRHRNRKILAQQIFLPRQIRKDALDLFFAPWYSAPILSSCPTVVGAWDISYTTHKSHYTLRGRLSLSILSRFSCLRSVGIFTCSPFDAKQIEKFYHIPHERICVLQLAAEDKFRPTDEEIYLQNFRKRYNFPKRYILSLGMIFNRRNVDIIIDAFKNIRKDYPDIGLVVVGQNSTVPFVDIKKKMKPMVDEGSAFYIPRLPEEDLVDIYRCAWYYICTSTVDGESIMMKEAMQCGTPVITSPLMEDSIGGIAEIIKDPTNCKETEEIFRKILSCPELRSEYSERGLKWIKQCSWENVARNSLNFLESR